ncbi:hypothetical protein F5883DRAFT_678217, partial [Diaporthe sp. PMI_573]
TALSRILLDRSESAWRAYFSADKAARSDHGFTGKANLTRLLDELTSQPSASQRVFADQLASRMESEVGASAPISKKRRITVEDHMVAAVPPPITPRSADTHPNDLEHHVPEQPPDHVISAEDKGSKDTHFGAPLKPAQELFQEQFWDSVHRIPGKQPGTWSADISMLFQQGHIREHFGCQMEIGIAEEKVADLAFEYFGVKVEIKDGVRSLRFQGSCKVEPDPSIKLRGCHRDLSGIFRGDLFEAARTSPIYQREENECRNRTDGVSMTISYYT